MSTLRIALLIALAAGCDSGGGRTDGGGGQGGSGGAPASCGFAACAQDLSCVDDPRDSCDPANGGADCPGVCVSCQQPMSNLCTAGTVRCGNTCCNAGEWCDSYFSSTPTCKCGNRAGCTGGNYCSAPGPASTSGCGSICCGAQGSPCPR